jgi:hypothetical protein
MIHTVFFITVRTVMTLLTYCNEENRTNRVVSLHFARNSFDPFKTLYGICFKGFPRKI